MIGRNLPYQALVQQKGILFDPVKFHWLGSPDVSNRVCVAIDGAAVQKASDLLQRELLVGGAGAGTAVSTTPVLLSKLLGLKFKLVEGYGSPSAILLAMERGEVQGICVTLDALRGARPGWIETGKMKVLFNTEQMALTDLKAPSIFELARTDEQRRILALYASSVELGRPIVAPPGVPDERVLALRGAFENAMAAPALRREAEKQHLVINVASILDRVTGRIAAMNRTLGDFLAREGVSVCGAATKELAPAEFQKIETRDHMQLAYELGRRAFLAHTVALHRQIKVIAVGIGAAGFCVWAICRPLGGSFDSAFRHAPRDLVLIIHMPSEVVEAGRPAFRLVLQERERDIAVGHKDRLASGRAFGGQPRHLECLLVKLRQPFGIERHNCKVTDLGPLSGHGDSSWRRTGKRGARYCKLLR